jgi:hypothetical protein
MGTGYGAPMLVHSRVYSHNIIPILNTYIKLVLNSTCW